MSGTVFRMGHRNRWRSLGRARERQVHAARSTRVTKKTEYPSPISIRLPDIPVFATGRGHLTRSRPKTDLKIVTPTHTIILTGRN
jgi:hypothetical protein